MIMREFPEDIVSEAGKVMAPALEKKEEFFAATRIVAELCAKARFVYQIDNILTEPSYVRRDLEADVGRDLSL